MPSTRTLQQTLNFCSTHGDLLPLANVGGYTNEPGLSLCNDAISDLISDPNDWKFNRVEMPMLVSCPNKLDQQFAGACAFTLNSSPTPPQTGWVSQGWGIALASASAVTVSGGVVTVNTLETHRIPSGATVYLIGLGAQSGNAAVPSAYNAIFTDNGSSSSWSGGVTLTGATATSFSFAAGAGQNNGDILGAPGITNFGYATNASLQEMNNTSSPPNIVDCTTYRELPYISRVANPDKISVLKDYGTGVLLIRWNFIPATATWGARIVYQAMAPTKVALTDTWAPFPDNFSAITNQAVLYRMYRYLNSPLADGEYKKLQAEIAKIHGTDSAETTAVRMAPEGLMDDSYWAGY